MASELADALASGLELGYDDWESCEPKAQDDSCCNHLTSGALVDGDMICAICLDHIDPVDTAIVRGCEHAYCLPCILKWACVGRESAITVCPQCKAPCEYLQVHRHLDGTVSDYLIEESMVLLKRAPWFQELMRVESHGPKFSSGHDAEGYYEDYDQHDYYDYDDEDDELEQYYFSSAAGRARVVLGNRRWGENGSVRSGRIFARPTGVASGAAGSSSSNTNNINAANKKANAGKNIGKPGNGNAGRGGASTASSGGVDGGSSGSSTAARAASSSADAPASVLTLPVSSANADVAGDAISSSASVATTASVAQAIIETVTTTPSSSSSATTTATPAGGSASTNKRNSNNKPAVNKQGNNQNKAKQQPASSPVAGTAATAQPTPAICTGRRARRNARRAAADLDWDDDYY